MRSLCISKVCAYGKLFMERIVIMKSLKRNIIIGIFLLVLIGGAYIVHMKFKGTGNMELVLDRNTKKNTTTVI